MRVWNLIDSHQPDSERANRTHTCVRRAGFPWWLRWWRICLQCRRPLFDPWVGKIPWRRKWQHIPVFLWEIPWTEEPGGLQSTGWVAKFSHDLMTKPPPPWRTKEPKTNILTFLFYQASYRTHLSFPLWMLVLIKKTLTPLRNQKPYCQWINIITFISYWCQVVRCPSEA